MRYDPFALTKDLYKTLRKREKMRKTVQRMFYILEYLHTSRNSDTIKYIEGRTKGKLKKAFEDNYGITLERYATGEKIFMNEKVDKLNTQELIDLLAISLLEGKVVTSKEEIYYFLRDAGFSDESGCPVYYQGCFGELI